MRALVAMDWCFEEKLVMERALCWREFTKKLDNVGFTDYIALLPSTKEQI